MVNGKQVLLKSKNNALFPISKNGPSNVLVQKDQVPTLGSTNYLDSNAVYEALTYKSDLNHTHTFFQDNINFNCRTSYRFLSKNSPGLPPLLYSLIDYDNSISVSSILDAPSETWSMNREAVEFFHAYDSKGNIIVQITEDRRHGTLDSLNNKYERYSFSILHYPPKNNIWSSATALEFIFKSDTNEGIITWSRPTQGNDAELSRVDWVKERVKNYSMPNYSRGTNIISDWPLSGWTNNLGNGFLLPTLKAGSTVLRKRLTLWVKLNESAYTRIFQYGTLGDDSCVGPIIPVLDGYTYILVSDENTDITSSVSISDNKRIIPHTATFYPIKF